MTAEPRHNGVYRAEYEVFGAMVERRPLPKRPLLWLIVKMPLDLIEGLLRFFPGAIGIKLRYFWYRMRLAKMGSNVIIGEGVYLNGPANISLADFVFLDTGVIVSAYLGPISIGRRVHIAPMCILGARAPIVLEDYVGLSAGVKIHSNSETPIGGKRMSGPMVSEDDKAFISAPVTLRKDSFVGDNGVILPGVEVGQGAVIGANSVISKSVEPWAIVVANGKRIGTREQVAVRDH